MFPGVQFIFSEWNPFLLTTWKENLLSQLWVQKVIQYPSNHLSWSSASRTTTVRIMKLEMASVRPEWALKRMVLVCNNYHLPVNYWLCGQYPFIIIIIILPSGWHFLSMNTLYRTATTKQSNKISSVFALKLYWLYSTVLHRVHIYYMNFVQLSCGCFIFYEKGSEQRLLGF